MPESVSQALECRSVNATDFASINRSNRAKIQFVFDAAHGYSMYLYQVYSTRQEMSSFITAFIQPRYCADSHDFS